MFLDDFTVWHKTNIPNLGKSFENLEAQAHYDHDGLSSCHRQALHLKTCQRELFIFFPSSEETASDALTNGRRLNFDVYHGEDAYAFLLRVTCGLESEMKGETQVFGQIKLACEKYFTESRWLGQADGHKHQAGRLKPVFQKLFEDAKNIRSKHLRNVGTASYGSILRKLLRDSPEPQKILVIGAGEFSKSLLPWLKAHDVTITNRTLAKAKNLAAPYDHKVLDWNDNQVQNWQGYSHCILAVQVSDELRAWFNNKASYFKDSIIFDLCEPGLNPMAQQVWTLADFYTLQKEENLKSLADLNAAFEACIRAAWERYHQGKMTFAHGWDDLWIPGQLQYHL